MSKAETAKRVIISDGGIADTGALSNAGLFRSDICRLADRGILRRICHGYYQLADDSIMEAMYISRLFPEAVVCMESALFYYGYSDFTPRQWSLAFPRNVSQRKMKIDIVPFKPFYIPPETYGIGITQADFDGVMLQIYDRDRTICDCFRRRSKMDSELFAKAVKAYARDDNKDLARLGKYAREFRIYRQMSNLMEVLLDE